MCEVDVISYAVQLQEYKQVFCTSISVRHMLPAQKTEA